MVYQNKKSIEKWASILHDKTAIQVVYKFVQKAREKRKEKKDTIFLIWTPGEGSILHPGE